ncbi:MAG: hypothetical protein A2857_02265 [Candidatus Levybacteria bacterium RIFCSPHIGHO2_01_FULL_36_15]|nr:MAG: hypothetical protein A2857_02265 [Candidatus Levybacteria bacterium RIFCSPHIGHO2_01_FULL_36_15]
MDINISVIITNYNRGKQLANSLISLKEAGASEIVVADDGSADKPDKIASYYKTKFISQRHKGFGLSKLRNLAVNLTRGNFLLFLDSDMIASRDLLITWKNVIASLETNAILYAMNGRYIYLASPNYVDWESPYETHDPREIGFRRKCKAFDKRFFANKSLSSQICHLFCGGHMLMSKFLYKEVHGFDEKFTVYGEEDWDFALSVWEKGFHLAFIKDALVYHIPHPRDQIDIEKSVNINKRYIIKKHNLIPKDILT